MPRLLALPLALAALALGTVACGSKSAAPTPKPLYRPPTTLDTSKYLGRVPSAPLPRVPSPPTTDWRAKAEQDQRAIDQDRRAREQDARARDQERRLDEIERCQDMPSWC